MLNVTIDAAALATPDAQASQREVYDYVDNLRDWYALLGSSWAAVVMSSRARDVLLESGVYPFFHHLRALFERHGVAEYDANTVTLIANKLLERTASFEAHFGVRDVLSQAVSTDPSIPDGLGDLRTETERVALLVAILGERARRLLDQDVLILRDSPAPTMKLRAEIHDIDHQRDDLPALPAPPVLFEGALWTCDSFFGLIAGIDESDVLASATRDSDVELAVRIALFKDGLPYERETDWTVAPPVIGSSFRESCRRCCVDRGRPTARKVLRSVVDAVKRRNMHKTHKLRYGKGPGDAQQTRGSDKAYRRDIDYELHLHYWQCGVATIELASVAYHGDFAIPV